MGTRSFDVCFLGGGIASSLMARYLKIKHPEFRIAVIEKNTKAHFNPGESTVQTAAMFLIRDLGLSTYLYLNHLPKNGLRYFFRDTRSQEEFDHRKCSEIGSNILPLFPTFQIDRARFDQDLWRLNAQIGVEMMTGTQIVSLGLGEKGSHHVLEVEKEGQIETLESKWIVNSLGRNAKITSVFEDRSPIVVDHGLGTAGAWGRFEGCGDIDLLGDEDWNQKVGFTARYLSTIHFMGRGFWAWHIPIDRGVVSWGVVYEKEVLGKDLQSREAFFQFLLDHPFMNKLVNKAKMLDFQCHPHLTFKRESFCSVDRWAVVGDAHGFIDPFYSPGSDVLSRQALFLDHLVSSTDEELSKTVDLVNRYTWYEYNLVRLLYMKQYNGFGSFEVFNIKSLWDFYSYTNRMVWYFYSKKFQDKEWLERELLYHEKTIELTKAIQQGFIDLTNWLDSTDQYESQNLGKYSLRQNRFRIEEDMLGGQYTDEKSNLLHLHLCRFTISELIERRFQAKGFLKNKLAQEALLFTSMVKFKLNDEWFASFLGFVAAKFRRVLESACGFSGEIRLTSSCFCRKMPVCFEGESQVVRENATQIWSQELENLVAKDLLADPVLG